MFGGADFIAYATAKAGVVGLTNALARAFGADDIRVNAIAPGAVDTEKQLRLWYDRGAGRRDRPRASCIKQRLLADEIARAALFLAADDSRMITKQCLIVDAAAWRSRLDAMLEIGLNPYGLTYVLGLQGRGTPRANPNGRGLEGFIAIAEELGAKTLEIFEPWLAEDDDARARRRSATGSPRSA